MMELTANIHTLNTKKPRPARKFVRYFEIDRSLEERGYQSSKTTKGPRFWRYKLADDFFLYARKRSVSWKLMSSHVYFDGSLIDLQIIVATLAGVICNQGTKINAAFDEFQVRKTQSSGYDERHGWKVNFESESACNAFLNVCEAFASGGLDEARSKASEFDQITAPKTSKSTVTESRVGQTKFRKDLLKYWKTCAVTNFKIERLLRASHIKPWSVANSTERLDTFNGLLLVPNLDALFDDGYISFNKLGHIMISSQLPETEYAGLGLATDMKLRKINGAHVPYLAFHFEHVFKP
jgi:HNH endonuclease